MPGTLFGSSFPVSIMIIFHFFSIVALNEEPGTSLCKGVRHHKRIPCLKLNSTVHRLLDWKQSVVSDTSSSILLFYSIKKFLRISFVESFLVSLYGRFYYRSTALHSR